MACTGMHITVKRDWLLDDKCTRHATLVACYQLVQSTLKIGFALAKKVGVPSTWQLPWLTGYIHVPFLTICHLYIMYIVYKMQVIYPQMLQDEGCKIVWPEAWLARGLDIAS